METEKLVVLYSTIRTLSFELKSIENDRNVVTENYVENFSENLLLLKE